MMIAAIIAFVLDHLDILGGVAGLASGGIGALFIGWKRWALIGAALAIIVGGYGVMKIRLANRATEIERLGRANDQLARDKAQAIQLAERNAAEALRIAEWNSRALAAVDADLQAARAQRARDAAIRERVRNVITEKPAACPVSPGLRAALDGLRAAQSAPAGAGNKNGAAAPAGGAAGLRGRTAGP